VERKKSRDLLSKSESKYRSLVEEALQGILIILPNPLRLVFVNDALGKMLGYSPKELLSLSPDAIKALVHPEDRAVFFKRMENRLRGEHAETRHEFRGLRKDGSIICMEAFSK